MIAKPRSYDVPQATVDVVLLTLLDNKLNVALLQREHEPYRGQWALPGGFVHTDEDTTLDDTAMRVLRGKVGYEPPYLEQLKTFGGPVRDPRGWSVSIAFYALVPSGTLDADAAEARTTAAAGRTPAAWASKPNGPVRWFPVDGLKSMPFDHLEIVQFARERLAIKAAYSSLPLFLMDGEFTLSEARAVYEAVMGGEVPEMKMRRRLEALGVIEKVGKPKQPRGATRSAPAQHYRLKSGRSGLAFVAMAESALGLKKT